MSSKRKMIRNQAKAVIKDPNKKELFTYLLTNQERVKNEYEYEKSINKQLNRIHRG